MKKLIAIIVFNLFSLYVYSQEITLKGVIKGQITRDAQPDVFISVVGANSGTTTKFDGSFKLKIPKEYSSNFLYISGFGCQDTLIPIRYFESNPVLFIKEWHIDLDEVVVFGEPSRVWYGDTNRIKNCMFPYIFDNGSSIGVYIKNKHNGVLKNIFIDIFKDKYFHSKFALRVKAIPHSLKQETSYFYGHYTDVLPHLVVTQADRSGVVKIDLSDYKIKVKKSEGIVINIFPLDEREHPIVSKEKRGFVVLQGARKEDNTCIALGAYEKKVKDMFSLRIIDGKLSYSKLLYPPKIAVEIDKF